MAVQTDVSDILVPNLWQEACVVMGNFSSQKEVAGIREAIEAIGHLGVFATRFARPQSY